MTSFSIETFDSKELMEGTWLPEVDTGKIRTLIIEYAYIPEDPLTERELVAQPLAILYSLGKQLEILTDNFAKLRFSYPKGIPHSITNYQRSINSALIIKIYRSFWHAAPIAYLSPKDNSSKKLQAARHLAIGQNIDGYIKQMASFQVDISLASRCKRKFIRISVLPFLPFEVACLLIQQPLKKKIRNECLRVWMSHFFQIPGSPLVSWDVKWLHDSKCIPLTGKQLTAIQTVRTTYPVTDPSSTWDIDHIITLVKLTIKKVSKNKIHGENPGMVIVPILPELAPKATGMEEFDRLCKAGMTILAAAKKIGSDQLCVMLKARHLHQVATYLPPKKRCRCRCSLSACWKGMVNFICSRSTTAPIHPDPGAVYRSAPAIE